MTDSTKEKLKKLIALHKQAYIPLKEQDIKPNQASSLKTKGLTRPDAKT